MAANLKHKTPVSDHVSNTSIKKNYDEPGIDEEESETIHENQFRDDIDQHKKHNDSDSYSVTHGENECHLCEKTFTCLDDLC